VERTYLPSARRLEGARGAKIGVAQTVEELAPILEISHPRLALGLSRRGGEKDPVRAAL